MNVVDFTKVLEYPRNKGGYYVLSNYEVTKAVKENGIIKANVIYNDNDSCIKLPNLNITKFEVKNSNVKTIWLMPYQNAVLDNAQIASKNKITSFKATNCPNLKQLLLQENLLTSIDISTLPNLQVLSMYANNISDIDISNNLFLKDLGLGSNNLTRVVMDRILQELINRNVQNFFVSFQSQKTFQTPTQSLVDAFKALSTSNLIFI